MLTFGELKTAERAILWPSPGEPRNLRLAHDRFFAEGMIDLQSWVPCLQANNTSVFSMCQTLVQCAKTVVPAPFGLIKKVYTIANGAFCDQVRYRSVNFDNLEAWARNLMLWWALPTNPPGREALTEGFQYPDKTNDNKCGRARTGIWAINRRRLYVTPWLESNESLVVEWDGVKTDWHDEDIIDEEQWSVEIRSAVGAYVKWRHEVSYGCDRARAMMLKEDYADQLGDIIWSCDRATEVQPAVEVEVVERYPSKAEIDAGKVPDEESEEVFLGNIADFGVDNSDEQAVADLVESKNPEFILSNGDACYLNGDDAYQRAVGDYFEKWITAKTFFGVPGNHDLETSDTIPDLTPYLEYFDYFPGNGRYFEKTFGPLHVFFLNSNSAYADPDGSGPSSNQAAWFKARAKLSPARWRLAIIHDAPYSDGIGNTPGHTLSRWDFSDMDLVLSGDSHGYQRFEVSGLPYIVNGGGGRTRPGFTAPTVNSKIIVDAFGAGFITCTCDSLKYEFYDVTGALRDILTLVKD